jgi:hypothetical protein
MAQTPLPQHQARAYQRVARRQLAMAEAVVMMLRSYRQEIIRSSTPA